MAIPQLKALTSSDLVRPQPPEEPDNCAVPVEAVIGPPDSVGGDVFRFIVITPRRLLTEPAPRWGRGLLIVPSFSWGAVEVAVTKLLLHAERPTWDQAAGELAKELLWEFENYTPNA